MNAGKRGWCEKGRVIGGAGGIRTPDLIIANDALSQLSYSPELRLVNPTTLEFPETELTSYRETFATLVRSLGIRSKRLRGVPCDSDYSPSPCSAGGCLHNSPDRWESGRNACASPLHRPSGWTCRPLKRRLSPE